MKLAGDLFAVWEDDESPNAEVFIEKFLVTDKDGTGHLPVDDARQMGAAWAALHGGYRGNKYSGPDKAEAIAKLKALYKSRGMDTPEESAISGMKLAGDLFAVLEDDESPNSDFTTAVAKGATGTTTTYSSKHSSKKVSIGKDKNGKHVVTTNYKTPARLRPTLRPSTARTKRRSTCSTVMASSIKFWLQRWITTIYSWRS